MNETTDLLRPGLLEGVSLLVAGAAASVAPFGGVVGEACTELGARVQTCAPDAIDELSIDQTVGAIVVETGSPSVLVVDGAALFAQGGLRTCLDATWNVTRAVVNQAFLPCDSSPSTRRILYLAPAPGVGDSAGAARAGLENLSRTLSTEWARHEITVVTIAPGNTTAAGEVAALCAYLASPAGAYFSGCLLDLSGP
jgi:hypothetical protein